MLNLNRKTHYVESSETEVKCIICESRWLILYHYPPNIFNNKSYHYYKCNNCKSLSISPLPELSEFELMYGEKDRCYLEEHSDGATLKHRLDFPKYNHQWYQLQFFGKDKHLAAGNRLLDFGCGSGFYMAFSNALGFESIGIEFNEEVARKLRISTRLSIYSVREFQKQYANSQFDVVHFGHILEHLADPKKAINEILRYTHPETLFIFDGPLESNKCLSRLVIDFGSLVKRKPYNQCAPQHLSFTTYDAQLHFFEGLGFKTLLYEAVEQPWPLPSQPDLLSISSLARFSLSRLSMFLSSLFREQGNIFHYVGKRA